MSMAGFLVNCSFTAVQLQQKQSQSLRLDPYVSHREGSIVVLPAAILRGPPDKYGLLTLGRPSVRCYFTLRAWSPVCDGTLRVSQEGNDGCSRLQGVFFSFCFFVFLVAQSFSPHRLLVNFLKRKILFWKG